MNSLSCDWPKHVQAQELQSAVVDSYARCSQLSAFFSLLNFTLMLPCFSLTLVASNFSSGSFFVTGAEASPGKTSAPQ